MGTETGNQRNQWSLALLGVFLGTQAGRSNPGFHMELGLQGPQGAGCLMQGHLGQGQPFPMSTFRPVLRGREGQF